jgi:hypothetical protein
MKSWLKSKTIWINTAFEVIGVLLLFTETVAALLPDPMAAKVTGAALIVTGVVNKVLRFLTKLGITVKKSEVTE